MLATADVQSGPRRLAQCADAIHHTLAERDPVLVSGSDIMEFSLREPGVDPLTIDAFARSWDDLTPDGFMADGWNTGPAIKAATPDKTGYRDGPVITFKRKSPSQDAERPAFF